MTVSVATGGQTFRPYIKKKKAMASESKFPKLKYNKWCHDHDGSLAI